MFPVLRKYNIAFYAYSPLAGGFFTQKRDVPTKEGGRFDTKFGIGQMYAAKYFKPSFFTALEKLESAAKGLSLVEIATRWIYHHSELKAQFGDAVIIGASKAYQIENSLEFARKGPLPKEIGDVLEQIWKDIGQDANPYYFPVGYDAALTPPQK